MQRSKCIPENRELCGFAVHVCVPPCLFLRKSALGSLGDFDGYDTALLGLNYCQRGASPECYLVKVKVLQWEENDPRMKDQTVRGIFKQAVF